MGEKQYIQTCMIVHVKRKMQELDARKITVAERMHVMFGL